MKNNLKYIPNQIFGLYVRNKAHAKIQIKENRINELVNMVRTQLLWRHREGVLKGVRYIWVYWEFGKKKPAHMDRVLMERR